MSFFAGTKKSTQAEVLPKYTGMSVETSCYGIVIPVVFGTARISGNLMWYGDFRSIKHEEVVASGGGGKGGGGTSSINTSYTYAVSFAQSICEGPVVGVGKSWVAKDSIAAGPPAGITQFLDGGQWGYMTTNHPAEDLYYPNICYFAGTDYGLGDNSSLPNFSHEIKGLNISVAPGIDAIPDDVVTGIVTNTKWGANLSASLIDVADWGTYCQASGLVVSPSYNEQRMLAEHLQELLDATVSDAILNDGSVLKIIPYADAAVTGNSVTWTPSVTPIYNLTDDDFLPNGDEGPVIVTVKSPADIYNNIKVEFLDRATDYNVAIAEASDQGDIDYTGITRTDSTKTLHLIKTAAAAQLCAQLTMHRNVYIRNKYEFKLPWNYCLLEPMDIVTITDTALGMTLYPVRIVEVTEGDDWEVEVIAEDFPAGVGSATASIPQVPGPYQPNFNVSPGDANAPVIMEVPHGLAANAAQPEIWIATSGGTNWGGCNVHVSTDGGTTYGMIGTVNSPARHGLVTNDPGHNPDPTYGTLGVLLADTTRQLLPAATQDADLLNTLCWVDGELMAYAGASLTAPGAYNLTYLVRGAYYTAIADHAIGTQFARLDPSIFEYLYNPDLVGTTIKIKLVSFNIYGGGIQDISGLTPVDYVVTGVGMVQTPAAPTSLAFAQELQYNAAGSFMSHFTVLSWDDPNAAFAEDQIDATQIEYKLSSEPTTWTIADGSYAKPTGFKLLGLPYGEYDFRVKFRNFLGEWGAYATLTSVAGSQLLTYQRDLVQQLLALPDGDGGVIVMKAGGVYAASTLEFPDKNIKLTSENGTGIISVAADQPGLVIRTVTGTGRTYEVENFTIQSNSVSGGGVLLGFGGILSSYAEGQAPADMKASKLKIKGVNINTAVAGDRPLLILPLDTNTTEIEISDLKVDGVARSISIDAYRYYIAPSADPIYPGISKFKASGCVLPASTVGVYATATELDVQRMSVNATITAIQLRSLGGTILATKNHDLIVGGSGVAAVTGVLTFGQGKTIVSENIMTLTSSYAGYRTVEGARGTGTEDSKTINNVINISTTGDYETNVYGTNSGAGVDVQGNNIKIDSVHTAGKNYGVLEQGDENQISNNTIDMVNSAANDFCIGITSGSDNNSLSSNVCKNYGTDVEDLGAGNKVYS